MIVLAFCRIGRGPNGFSGAKAQTVFPVPDWQVDKPEAQQMSAEGLEKVGKWLKDNGSKTGLVVRHGRIVGEWYFDDAKADSQVPGLFDHQVVRQHGRRIGDRRGQAEARQQGGRFFPDATPPQKREITVRQLLSMTSGAHNDNAILNKNDLFT